MTRSISSHKLFGTILIPPSKSDAQRALLAASLSKEMTQIYNLGQSDDERSMLQNIEVLGARVVDRHDYLEIQGPLSSNDSLSINVGESGLGLRLLTPVTLVFSANVSIDGKGSLLFRSQRFLEQQLVDLGVKVNSNKGFLPLHIKGNLKSGKHTLDGSISSQFLSGLLMTFPLLEEDTELTVENLRSIPYVKMTLNTLASFGIQIEQRAFEYFYIKGNQKYLGTKYAVEGDWSSASYWLVAAALGHKVNVLGLSLESEQADKAILDALETANCVIKIDEGGITVDGTSRTAFTFDCTHCPDLFPALVSFAAHCDGVSILSGADRLIHKESNRALALVEEFSKLGIEVFFEDNTLSVKGGKINGGQNLQSHNDHRIAMCLAIASLSATEPNEISHANSVDKSYPSFWNHLEELTIL